MYRYALYINNRYKTIVHHSEPDHITGKVATIV